MKIKINKKEYNFKYTLRAIFIFEKITDKPFKIETVMDNYLFYYSIILANNMDKPIEWDEFIDAIDNDPKIFEKLTKYVEKENRRDELFSDDSEKDNSKKK